ncbi:hypothetical protein NFHSH190041_16950 [Shewanella sp. NFH-SH190041]|nr:hypothetical protein NFHSH190041_16950 [Shewanella sp. NFH-SH190041]
MLNAYAIWNDNPFRMAAFTILTVTVSQCFIELAAMLLILLKTRIIKPTRTGLVASKHWQKGSSYVVLHYHPNNLGTPPTSLVSRQPTLGQYRPAAC